MAKKSSTSDKNEKMIDSLEFDFDKLMIDFRELVKEKKFRKQHEIMLNELKYAIGNIDQRLHPRKGPLKW